MKLQFLLLCLVLCGAASAQIINPGGGGGGGFANPAGWAKGTNSGSGAANRLDNSATESLSGTPVGLFTNVWNPTFTNAVVDAKMFGSSGTMTGAAALNSTWATTYNTFTYNLTSGTLTHALHDVQRATCTNSAATTISVCAAGFFSTGLVNLNGATDDIEIIELSWDALSSTGTFTNGLTGLNVKLPAAITGSPTVPAVIGVKVADPTVAGVPGTTKAGYSIGTPSGGGTYGFWMANGIGGNYTNPIAVTGGGTPAYFQPGFITGAVNSISGSGLNANTTSEITNNNLPAMLGFYNGAYTWEAGIVDNAGNYAIRNSPAASNSIFISKTDNHIDAASTIFANGNRVFVASDFTTAANTNLQNITGLTWTLPASLAENVSFTCSLPYSQATGAAAVSFGISASVAPTQINASGEIYTSASVFAAGNLQALASTTATAIVTGTPSAITTIWNANIRGFIENPSTTASTITIMVKTATAADAVTVKRGGFCTIF